jgi:hypothetical protein
MELEVLFGVGCWTKYATCQVYHGKQRRENLLVFYIGWHPQSGVFRKKAKNFENEAIVKVFGSEGGGGKKESEK